VLILGSCVFRPEISPRESAKSSFGMLICINPIYVVFPLFRGCVRGQGAEKVERGDCEEGEGHAIRIIALVLHGCVSSMVTTNEHGIDSSAERIDGKGVEDGRWRTLQPWGGT